MAMRHASMTRARLVVARRGRVLASRFRRAERMGYPPEEFAARRQQLAKVLQRGTLLMFGAHAPAPGLRFRQDNDFYYLTGNESLNAALVMDAPTRRVASVPAEAECHEIRYEGGNWLEEPDAARKYGFASIQPLTALHEFLARRRTAGTERCGRVCPNATT